MTFCPNPSRNDFITSCRTRRMTIKAVLPLCFRFVLVTDESIRPQRGDQEEERAIFSCRLLNKMTDNICGDSQLGRRTFNIELHLNSSSRSQIPKRSTDARAFSLSRLNAFGRRLNRQSVGFTSRTSCLVSFMSVGTSFCSGGG